LKGPRLEIPLFAGDDPIGWLQKCEKFLDMSGTTYEQWVNIATGHFYGRANVWMKNRCVLCQMIAHRFTQANAHEAVDRLKNIQQYGSVQSVIAEPTGLPPPRCCDHCIPLVEGAQHQICDPTECLRCKNMQWRRSSSKC
jgi:hypothetical protein